MKPNKASLTITSILLYGINRGLGFVNKIRVEDVKLVTLHYLWRWIIMIIVRLVVFVPLVTCVNAVEILGLSRTIFVMPPVNLHAHPSKLMQVTQCFKYLKNK